MRECVMLHHAPVGLCESFWLSLALTLCLCQPFTACTCRNITLHFTAEAEWQLVLVINYPIISICGEPTASQISQLPVLCPGSCLVAVGTARGVAAARFRAEWPPALVGQCWGLGCGRALVGATELSKGLGGASSCGEMLLLWAALGAGLHVGGTKIPELSSLWVLNSSQILLCFTVKKKKKR